MLLLRHNFYFSPFPYRAAHRFSSLIVIINLFIGPGNFNQLRNVIHRSAQRYFSFSGLTFLIEVRAPGINRCQTAIAEFSQLKIILPRMFVVPERFRFFNSYCGCHRTVNADASFMVNSSFSFVAHFLHHRFLIGLSIGSVL